MQSLTRIMMAEVHGWGEASRAGAGGNLDPMGSMGSSSEALRPMAWSDNILAFGPSSEAVATSLSCAGFAFSSMRRAASVLAWWRWTSAGGVGLHGVRARAECRSACILVLWW